MDANEITCYIMLGLIALVCSGLATCLFALSHHIYTTRGGKTRTNETNTLPNPHTPEDVDDEPDYEWMNDVMRGR